LPVRAVSRFPENAASNPNPEADTDPEAFSESSRFGRSVQALARRPQAVPFNLVPEM
jgi:hypothetical protein